ncbi:MAG: DUF1549 domain-containing protein [Singulisphaera sp.]
MCRSLLLVCWNLCAAAIALAGEPAPSTSPPAGPNLFTANFVDEQLFSRQREQGIVPSPVADDGNFLRRLTLLTTGQLPTSAEVRDFVANRQTEKRARKIDQLLDHPLHAALWATRYAELTGNALEALEDPAELKPKRAKMWHDWLRRRFARNMPYDQIVRGILTATSHGPEETDAWIDQEAQLVYQAREGFDSAYADRPTLDLFWRRANVADNYPIEQLAERVASTFLGVRINCARCHDHPFERWTQDDYRHFVQIFAPVRFDQSPELRGQLTERIEARRRQAAEGTVTDRPLPRLRDVYLAESPGSAANALRPKALAGPEFLMAVDKERAVPHDARVPLMDWLCEPQNPFFARNLANRLWAHYFGRGLVEPLDAIATADDRPHARLLDLLAADFVAHGYDLRHTERVLLNSTAWQLSSLPNDTNRTDTDAFSRAYVRMPPAYTVIDMWRGATGIITDFGSSVPTGLFAVEIAPDRLGDNRWNGIITLFGHYPRQQTCDCGATNTPTIRQALTLMSDENLLGDLSSGDLPKLLASGLTDEELLDELFLRTLSRPPTIDESAAALTAVNDSQDRSAAFQDILWALVNTQEFITIH